MQRPIMEAIDDRRPSAGLLALAIGLLLLLAWSGTVASSPDASSAQTTELCAGALLLSALCVLAHALHEAARKASVSAGAIHLVSSLALWLLGGVIVQLLIVCAGAPLLPTSVWGIERLALGLVLSALVWLPAAQRLGGDAQKWQCEFFLRAPAAVAPTVVSSNPPSFRLDAAVPNATPTSAGATGAPSRSLPVSLPSLSSLFGCCLLSLLLPLDWATRWQCFPTPNLLGASLGYVCGAAAIAIEQRKIGQAGVRKRDEGAD